MRLRGFGPSGTTEANLIIGYDFARVRKRMLRQFLMGGAISVCNIVIHALVMTVVVRASQTTAVKIAARPNLLLIAVMVATVSVLMAAHASEVVRVVAGLWCRRRSPSRHRSFILRICELHDAGIRRRCSGRALAIDGADDGNEWSFIVRLVDSRNLRGAAQSDGGHDCRQFWASRSS